MSSAKSEPTLFETASKSIEPGETPAQVDAAIQGTLGRKLRETYDQVVQEQVPERLLQLLDELKKKEQDSNKGGA